ncbi:MAG: hypothetical protein M1828_006642 [Chrysothrix sp. TS-e1954]|nr:MAG: hypothetical protein M1828_006642 [Chrysothrix sp. TS-e1954]
MPVQKVLFGRPVTLQLPPRRFIVAFGLTLGFILLLVTTIPSSTRVELPTVAEISETAHEAAHHALEVIPKSAKQWNPFSQNVHEPPEQANSTHGDTKWYSHWNWMNPFSSLVSLDEQRAVLPTVPNRSPIYTYYEPSENRKERDAEHELILTWRRAWWAKGFRPVVLGRGEAMKNPLYEQLQVRKFEPKVEEEIIRWLAWGHMGGGILANWLALPMGPYDDNLIEYLRRGEFLKVTRYKNLGSGLFAGSKDQINHSISKIIDANDKDQPGGPFDIVGTAIVDSKADSIAFYNLETIKAKYEGVAAELAESKIKGLQSLRQLIDSHLQGTWQSAFTSGIAVIKPRPKHMTTLTGRGNQVAKILQKCVDSPAPKSCPPNRKSCKPCDPDRLMQINSPDTFLNKTSLFTVGPVPHPLTFNTAQHFRETLDVSFIRRNTLRDQWLEHVTRDLLGETISGPQRLVRFKEAVASAPGIWQSLWLTAESEEPLELEWIFGFSMPQIDLRKPQKMVQVKEKVQEEAKKMVERLNPLDTLEDEDSHIRKPASELDPKVSAEMDVAKEKVLMEHAHKMIKSKGKKEKATKAMVEAWDMADTEAWRFVRAFGMRRNVERHKWEEDEKKFAGAEGGGRWFDRRVIAR